MLNKRTRNYETVKIELGYTALVDLRRFFMRGVNCSRERHRGYDIRGPDNFDALKKKLDSAMYEMRKIKAKAKLKD